MSPTPGKLAVGTSGYQYDHWRGVFYPEGLPKDQWFAHYAEHFDTVEINNTFYHLPRAKTFDDWRRKAPGSFCYALKFSRYATHLKKLKDPEASVGLFMERAKRLGATLGPILVQLPPHWRADVDRLAAFLEAVPGDQRWAVEFRDPSWLCEAIYAVLRHHHAALCIHDLIPAHPRRLTADWVYLRFHGAGNGGDYSRQALAGAAQRIKRHLAEGRDVFAYFNNDAYGYAVSNAADLRRYLGEG
jgi:uncharacterized protein YecE (DUF72 family)